VSELLVEVDGQVVPLTKCSWVFRGSCGCAYGVMIAVSGAKLCATEDQAWEDFEPNRVQRERDRAAGDTATLALTSDAVDNLRVGCPHEPKYGHPVTVVPDGYLWAAADGFRSRPRFKHLLAQPTEARDPRMPRRLHSYEHGKVAALCKRSTSRDWVDDDWLLRDLPECSACQKAAGQAVAS
jgi:hypothetical protein